MRQIQRVHVQQGAAVSPEHDRVRLCAWRRSSRTGPRSRRRDVLVPFSIRSTPLSSLTRLSLANRAVIALATLITIGAGLWATVSLKQELIPSMDIPVAGVVTVVPGAGPAAVERDVTDPLERSVTYVAGVVGTTSSSASGFSVVTVELDYGTDMTQASQELQQAVRSEEHTSELQSRGHLVCRLLL